MPDSFKYNLLLIMDYPAKSLLTFSAPVSTVADDCRGSITRVNLYKISCKCYRPYRHLHKLHHQDLVPGRRGDAGLARWDD
jgi:hypothetical protein